MCQLEQHWYRSSHTLLTLLLLPLSWFFYGVVTIRQYLYRVKIKKAVHFAQPVIVVGNITAGGTGKTPLVIWLVHFLKAQGFMPGVVSRGYGGMVQKKPYWIRTDTDAAAAGDEALVLARRCDCPVVISVDRVAAVRELLANTNCDVVISDDGLQHYRLGRNVEIAVIDGARGFGNGSLLPAGPLRESVRRLQTVDLIVRQGDALQGEYAMHLRGSELIAVADEQMQISLENYRGQSVHAVAGIGHPQRFFSTLREHGIHVIEHVFPDHYCFKASDLLFADRLPILMTEKDAVKCLAFADERYWYLPVTAELDQGFGVAVMAKLK